MASSKTFHDLVNMLSKSEMSSKSVLSDGFMKKDRMVPYHTKLKHLRQKRKEERDKTKGKNWFNMPRTEMTEERKNDLTVLQMRHVLDPKRFYKKNESSVLPKYFQIGTVVESAADFYHSRIPKKQRKRTIVEELLADADFSKVKTKFEEQHPKKIIKKFKHKEKKINLKKTMKKSTKKSNKKSTKKSPKTKSE